MLFFQHRYSKNNNKILINKNTLAIALLLSNIDSSKTSLNNTQISSTVNSNYGSSSESSCFFYLIKINETIKIIIT